MKIFIRILCIYVAFVSIYIPVIRSQQTGILAAVVSQQVVSEQRPAQRQALCASCLAAWGINRRPGCTHSFCARCYTDLVVTECPTCTEEANQCAICLELFDNTVKTLVCGHMFCGGCIVSWQAAQTAHELEQRCPSCRAPLVFKETVSCEICKVPFKDSDDITPPLVCKLIGWAVWREKYVCVQQFAHRFHDRCFNLHYIQPGQHTSNLREHTCVCPIHVKIEKCSQHVDRCSLYDHPWGHIKLPLILPDRDGPREYVEYEPVQPPSSAAPSPRTARDAEDIVNLNERNDLLNGKVSECSIM